MEITQGRGFNEAEQYTKRVLLIVIGMTPQIVTETLYKLAVKKQPRFIPTEIHLITTKEGANSAKVALLGTPGDLGKFCQLCNDYHLENIDFTEDNIHIIADTEGGFIDDSDSTKHNQIAADFITRTIKTFADRQDTALHVSLAGGRKTMSYYAGYALSLYGRMQDRLSHTIVNYPFMNHKDFFYPRPKAERFEVNNRYYSTDEANIILSDIPYVRMRYQMPKPLLQGEAGFQETVNKIQRFNEAPSIYLYTQKRIIELNGVSVKLTLIEFVFYLWMSEHKQQKQAPLILEADDFMFDFLKVYSRFTNPEGGMYERVENIARKKDITGQKKWFGERRSKIKAKIEAELGEYLSLAFLVQPTEYKNKTSYTIAVAPERITIFK